MRRYEHVLASLRSRLIVELSCLDMVQNEHIQLDSPAMTRRSDEALVSSPRVLASSLNCQAGLKHALGMFQNGYIQLYSLAMRR